MTDLTALPATELAALVRRRAVSPVEVVDAALAAIEARNPAINAIIHLGAEDARAAAAEAERAVLRGDAVGPLHGVPTAIKDLFDFKVGWPATFGGIPALAGFVTDFACAWCARMEAAGAIVVGKTNSPVMGFRGTTDNPLFGPTRNPFDLERNAGGSSGGAGAVVAEGLLPLAEGTDAGGSVRIPAAWCGVFGFKPTFGLTSFVSRPNAFIGTSPFPLEGVLSRTVDDAALALGALIGPEPLDPQNVGVLARPLAAAAPPESLAGVRVAYSPNLDVFPVEPEVAAVVADAVRALEAAGAHVEEVQLGLQRDQRELCDLWCRMMQGLNLDGLDSFKAQGLDLLADHRDELPPEYVAWAERGAALTLRDVLADQRVRTEVFDAIEGVFARFDLLVTPTTGCLPSPNATDGLTRGPSTVDGVEVDPLIGWALTYPINFTGHPAASVPAGLSAGGLPVGMQLVGRRFHDADVLAASRAVERVRPWAGTYAQLASRRAAA